MAVEITKFNKAPNVPVDKFRDTVEAAYTAWVANKRGRLPTPKEVAEYCSFSADVAARIMDTREFAAIISGRGVPWVEGGTYNQGLTAEQQLALSVILNPTDRRTLENKLKAIKVPYARYRAWLKQPLFARAVQNISEDMLQDHIGDVHVALTNKATNGDINAIKLYYEVTGRFDPAQKQVQELKGMVTILLEILTTHIKDPVVLQAIAGDMQKKLGETIKGEIV